MEEGCMSVVVGNGLAYGLSRVDDGCEGFFVGEVFPKVVPVAMDHVANWFRLSEFSFDHFQNCGSARSVCGNVNIGYREDVVG
jgi:hypothetical protein